MYTYYIFLCSGLVVDSTSIFPVCLSVWLSVCWSVAIDSAMSVNRRDARVRSKSFVDLSACLSVRVPTGRLVNNLRLGLVLSISRFLSHFKGNIQVITTNSPLFTMESRGCWRKTKSCCCLSPPNDSALVVLNDITDLDDHHLSGLDNANAQRLLDDAVETNSSAGRVTCGLDASPSYVWLFRAPVPLCARFCLCVSVCECVSHQRVYVLIVSACVTAFEYSLNVVGLNTITKLICRRMVRSILILCTVSHFVTVALAIC